MSRVARWLWESPTIAARVARMGLTPTAFGVEALATVRASAYRAGIFRGQRLPLPAVSVGNLSVGGTGKTPIASWIAGYYANRGLKPGVLLRGYGEDEGAVHRRLVPAAVVVEDPNRLRGARKAAGTGAEILVLDDAFQRLDVKRDIDMVLLAAESAATSRRIIPAGPWRERRGALSRAGLVVVTRKRAPFDQAEQLARTLESVVPQACPVALAELQLASMEGLFSGRRFPVSMVRGARVLAVAGVADPASFGAQLSALGAVVELQAWRDHHPYRAGDVARMRRAAKQADLVVMTLKDAVKVREIWPVGAPEPLIANIAVRWERFGDQVERALDALTNHIVAGAHERR